MAEGLLYNFIEKLIGKLGSMAVESCNMRDDVGKLVENMSEIKAVVLDAEEQQGTNHEVQVWVGKLKDALDDAENLLDEISTEDLSRQVITRGKKAKKVRIFFSKSNQLLFSSKMARRVKDLGERIKDLNVGRRGFSFTSRTLEQRVIKVMKQRETGSFICEEDVIGREEEKKQLVELLLETNMDLKENVSIISIVGIGGLGKTALAQLVYNDEEVKNHFRELQMWVCVADEFSAFDVKEVGMKIIGAKPSDELDLDRVQQALQEKMRGKRYLLVLDDIWNENRELWLRLMTLLREGAKGSKIIITTRSKKVSKICGASSSLVLKGLDEEQSWKLFAQLAFEDGKEPENQKMVLIGKEIVKKCSGVPLAIRSIGGLMYSMETESEWQIFKDKDLVKMDNEGGMEVLEILKISYDHLPFHLKRCFAFCSLFPKDYMIWKDNLIKLWVAHGFVELWDERMCMEDVGNEFFVNLSQRSFFQDFERDDLSGDILVCKMHDLVHDLAKLVSANDCVILTSKEQQIDRGTRHLSLNFEVDSSWQVPSSLLKANKLRTFLDVRFGYSQKLEESACTSIISSLQQVRVLDLHFSCCRLPSCIGKLVHLRYLDLSWNRLIAVLPPSITELHNLQTLLLTGCSELKELPRDLWKLVNLRHLQLGDCDALTCMPPGIGQLTNLQTLATFVLDTKSKCKQSSGPSELHGLNNLKGYVQIRGLECLRRNPSKAKDFNLKAKSRLLHLHLIWGNDERFGEGRDEDNVILEALLSAPNIKILYIEGFGGDAISVSITSFTNLQCVQLEQCTRLQYLPPLHLLLHLRDLQLEGLPGVECIYNNDGSSNDTSSIFFPSLNQIYLSDLPNLKGWCRCSEESCQHRFKALDQLWIKNCPNLISIPQHSYIKDVELSRVNEKILERAVKHSQVSSLRIENIYGLRSLSRILQHLVAVSTLQISSCEELDPCNDEDGYYALQWTQLANLRSLELNNIPKMESLPDGLQHVTSLETLSISDCANMKCIPEWVTSLQQHQIGGCPNLTSILEGVNVEQSET